jgi:16S rRNA (guanine527-N7)-methyltransferase
MNAEELLKQGLKELDVSCTGEQVSSFMTYLSELKKWNRAYNLTALKKDEDIIIKHFLDSLLYIKAFPAGNFKLIDAGAGAGFPGIPVRIVRPEIDVTLIESSRKKAAFLRHITRSLGLTDIAVLEQRLEHLGTEHERAYDVIVSRATFSVGEFLKTACPYVKENGRLILNKGPKLPEELKEPGAAEAVKEVLRLRLPITNDERNLVVLGCEESAQVRKLVSS